MIPGQEQQQPMPQQQQGIAPSQQPMPDDYALFVSRGLEMISAEQTKDGILTMLRAKDPVQSLADTLIVIIHKLDDAARQKGVEVQDSIKILGAHELINELAKVAKAANIFDLDKDHIELAFSVAVQDYVREEVQAGRINPGKLQAQMQSGVNKMGTKEREEMQAAQERIQKTARGYNGGQGYQQRPQGEAMQ